MKHKELRRGAARRNLVWWVAGLSVMAAAFLIALNMMAAKGGTPAAKSDAELVAVRNVRGKETAPVTLVEFGDYQ